MWTPAGDGRWTIPDDPDRHLLLRGPLLLGELHGRWLHRYVPAVDAPADWPLADAQHTDTVELADPPTTDEQGWQLLTDATKES